ncbi:MAG: molybdopterin-binding protein [Xanthobacteraceae bacterium]
MAQDFSNPDSSFQRISRLTPRGAILALIGSEVGATKPWQCALAQAINLALAADIVVSEQPPHPMALRDGFAVAAAALADVGPYAPMPFESPPRRVDSGEALPVGTDAVAPLDAIAFRKDRAEAIAAVTAGESVLPAGGDAAARTPLRRAGERLRALDIAVMAAAGVTDVAIRSPRLRIAYASAAKTSLIDAALGMLARFLVNAGGTVLGAAIPLEEALTDDQADAVIAIGGTGSGRADISVKTLARLGRVAAHGIAISPGETAAFGFVGARPVLLMPGRLDAVLAVWLLVGRQLVAQLASGDVEAMPAIMTLKRKVASTIGLTELVPVRCADGMAEPLASGYLSFAVLTRSDGFIVVPADSEGFAADTPVAVTPWP